MGCRNATSWRHVLWETAAVRRLVVVRHAKAQRDSPSGDHGRALSSRGRAQAEALRTWTVGDGPLAAIRGTVVVSDAVRTIETFELALDATPCCERSVVDPSLYNGARHVSTDDVLTALRAADPGTGDLMVVAHNPTVVHLVHDLADDERAADEHLLDGFPLCGVAILAFDGTAPAHHGCVLVSLDAPAR
jgi:phosphohistidine phosphatase